MQLKKVAPPKQPRHTPCPTGPPAYSGSHALRAFPHATAATRPRQQRQQGPAPRPARHDCWPLAVTPPVPPPAYPYAAADSHRASPAPVPAPVAPPA